MTCDFGRKNLIAVRMVEGNIVSPDIEIPDVAKKENYSLKNIGPGDLVTFDDIIVQKEGKCFRIKPFLVFTKL